MEEADNPFDMVDDALFGDDNLLGNDQGGSTEEVGGQMSSTQDESVKAEEKEKEEKENNRVGTPFYLAPELWKNQKNTKEADIWALGVILYEMCCFKYPFPAKEMDELEKKVLNDPIQKIPNNVTKEFKDLITKMLKKDASKRPTIEEIIYSDVFQ